MNDQARSAAREQDETLARLRGPHEVGKPCPRKPHMMVTTRDFEREKCGACGTALLTLDAYMDRGGR